MNAHDHTEGAIAQGVARAGLAPPKRMLGVPDIAGSMREAGSNPRTAFDPWGSHPVAGGVRQSAGSGSWR